MKAYLTLCLSVLLVNSACSTKKQEDPTLNGIWQGKVENLNEKTGERKIEVVIYEFRNENIAIHYLSEFDNGVREQYQVQTDKGIYKKVKDSIEISVNESTCAFYSVNDNSTAYNDKKSRKIFYSLSEDLSTLTLKGLAKNLELKRLSQDEESAVAGMLKESQSGCYNHESNQFELNELTAVDKIEPRSTDPL